MPKRRFQHLSNKDLLGEYKHIKNRDPSSYNWTPSDRKAIRTELKLRKKQGLLKKSAGTKRRSRGLFDIF